MKSTLRVKKHDICINPNGYTAQSYLIFPRFRAMNIGCVESDPYIWMLHLRLHQDALLPRHTRIYRRGWWRSGGGGEWPLSVLPIIILKFSVSFFLVVFPGPLLPLTANGYFTEDHLKFTRITNHNRDWQETFPVRRCDTYHHVFFFNYLEWTAFRIGRNKNKPNLLKNLQQMAGPSQQLHFNQQLYFSKFERYFFFSVWNDFRWRFESIGWERSQLARCVVCVGD